jgi:hypothetical protein
MGLGDISLIHSQRHMEEIRQLRRKEMEERQEHKKSKFVRYILVPGNKLKRILTAFQEEAKDAIRKKRKRTTGGEDEDSYTKKSPLKSIIKKESKKRVSFAS